MMGGGGGGGGPEVTILVHIPEELAGGVIGKGGQVAQRSSGGGGGLSSGQKGFLALAAILVGPSVLKKVYDKPKEAVDLSNYNIVTHYETPAIERMDSTLRIEFCQS